MPTSQLMGLMHFCTRPQLRLDQVQRWSSWQREEIPQKARVQNTLQHTHSIVLLAHLAIVRLRPYAWIKDPEFLLCAFLVHDHGEGELGYDTLDPLKTAKGDVDEYEAFVGSLDHDACDLDPGSRAYLERAFLLQFSLKDGEHRAAFPHPAQEIMEELSRTHREEALLFAALEQLDYVFYALEQHRDGVDLILREVLERQMPHLERAAEVIPGFREELWTHDCRDRAHAFLRGELVPIGA